jgi:putative CocE/NonD family hydrolase
VSTTVLICASLLLPIVGQAQPAVALTVDKDVKVAMRDGVQLASDVYRPKAPGAYPAIVARTPYGKGMLADDAAFFARNGYAFIAQDVRGRYDSQGTFEMYLHDDVDGFDTAQWLNAQPWFNKQQGFGLYGESYLASTALSLAETNPPNLKAAYLSFASANYHDDGAWRGGAFELAHNVFFTTLTVCPNVLEHAHRSTSILPGGGSGDRIFALENATPLNQPLLSENCPWYQDWTTNPDEDDYWNQPGLNHVAYADRLPPIALALVSGWYDQFLGGTVLDYQNAPGEVSLTLGPWIHGGSDRSTAGDGAFGPSARIDKQGEALRWFDRYLKGADVPRPEPVRYFLMGGAGDSTAMGGVWQTAPTWPPPDVEYVPYYLHGGGGLGPDLPSRLDPPDGYAYDPLDPMPTVGGNISSGSIFAPTGAYVQRCRPEWPACRGSSFDLAERSDVLTYQTDPLGQDLAVVGPLSVELWAATDAADTDFTAKLVDVSPDGEAVNVADGIIRARYNDSRTEASFVPPGTVKNYTIDLWHTAMLFKAGHSIRVDISSSNFPQFDRNLNTGNPLDTDVLDDAVVANQTIYHDAVRASHIVLPILR